VRRSFFPRVLSAVASLALVAWSALPADTANARPAAVAPPAAGELATPVLSARRAPDALRRAAATVRLHNGLSAAIADPDLGPARQASCLQVDGPTGTTFRWGSEDGLIPASNLKLITALAVLTRIGPDERFTTRVVASRPPVGGVVDGNLYLIGSGDPVLQTAGYNDSLDEGKLDPGEYTHIEDLAAAVKAAGITRVNGAVIGDESRYDTQRYVPTWKPGYMSDSEIGPLSAASVDDGFVQFAPLPMVPAPSPAVLAAGVLNALLMKGGVKVTGEPGQGTAPAGATPVGAVSSPPVGTIVAEMLRHSDNNTAELLTKELGKRFGGAGTTAAGVGVIRQVVAEQGLPVDDLAAVDGSGLDRSDRATCRLLLGVLEKAGPASTLVASLPVAAQSGTLRKRFAGTPAAGRLAAKTGSLNHVSSLSGYVKGASGPIAFALVANALPRDALGRELGDRVGAVLAAYPDAPPAAQLVPLPVRSASRPLAGIAPAPGTEGGHR
jgi:D-alanyl-D-alanine carboxypeptidase/D-alanyl-D-alanine-endopeptidase (penicillin-binding protein 4)